MTTFRRRRRRRPLCMQPIIFRGGLVLLALTCFQLHLFNQSHELTTRSIYNHAVDFLDHFLMPIATPSLSLPWNNEDHDSNSITSLVYPEDGIPMGIRSNISMRILRKLQREVDQSSHEERCQRYGYTYNRTSPKRRRIFYGALIANEPWELLEIVAAESYGIFEGMVFVESNRTQNFNSRPFRRLRHGPILRQLFGARQVQVRFFVNEDEGLMDLDREHSQRNEIIRGWKEMGMTANDIGYLTDPDETFSRDFLRAAQVCDGIVAFDYEAHYCRGKQGVKLISKSRVFEMSPECIIRGYEWYHPDMVLGACIELIGNSSIHPFAPRNGIERAGTGIGALHCGDWHEPSNQSFPLWTPADIRALCGGRQAVLVDNSGLYDPYTGYHFHNFFSDFKATRIKYHSYAHPNPYAMVIPLEDLNDETMVGTLCLKNTSDNVRARHKRVVGGFDRIRRTVPLYFMNQDYRQQRHVYMQEKVLADEKATAERSQREPHLILAYAQSTKPPQKERRKRHRRHSNAASQNVNNPTAKRRPP